MLLVVKLGQVVVVDIVGHSNQNGATIPEGATIALTSNDPAVATVPETVPAPAGGAQTITVPVTVLAVGITDIHCTVTTVDGVYEATATLAVEPAPEPGLARIELVLRVVEV